MVPDPVTMSDPLDDSFHPSLRFVAGDKVRFIYLNKLRTGTVVSHYDGTLTIRWREVIAKRSVSQVIKSASRQR